MRIVLTEYKISHKTRKYTTIIVITFYTMKVYAGKLNADEMYGNGARAKLKSFAHIVFVYFC